MTTPATKPPGRALLRLAGVFTQVACAGCLLLGTIAFVLIQQNKTGGTALAIAWALAAMLGLVFGGLMARGGLITVLGSGVLDLAFGITLLVLGEDTFASLLRVLSRTDVVMVQDAVLGGAIGMLIVGVLCFVAIPQAIRYGKWLRDDVELAQQPSSTERGFPPPPARVTGSMWRAPAAPPAEVRSRRRMYFALGGFAIGFGAGIGVLVSSTTRTRAHTPAAPTQPSTPDRDAPTPPTKPPTTPTAPVAKQPAGGLITSTVAKVTDVHVFLREQRDALARGDVDTLVAMLAQNAIGIGTNADGVAEGNAKVAAQLDRDLGDLPAKGLSVEIPFEHVGQEQNHAWIAQTIQLRASGVTRTFAVTQLVAFVGGRWQIVAWHWATLVRDDVAERVALLGTKPVPVAIADKLDGPKPLDTAIRAAYASRQAAADARSERDDAINVGSAPKELILGGANIKRVFGKLKSQIRLHDGVRAIAGSAWDPAQKTAPWIAVAVLNADYTFKTKAATDLTHTFRVLAVLVREGESWKLVQTQWSHGGPIR
ncbi:MAG TPA: nuclear transport factor 2 family protein [Kofleriaceae bacterium]|nr:nuclear transport factor 2 family protein [Kofleriaceae bacterium]